MTSLKMRGLCITWMNVQDELQNDSFFYQPDAKILYFNTFITFFYMLRALLFSSLGGQLY